MGTAASSGLSQNSFPATPTTDDMIRQRPDAAGGLTTTQALHYSEADAATIASDCFVEYDACQSGLVSVDTLVAVTVNYFATLETHQPENWIRALVGKQDVDGDGHLSEVEFATAVDSLRRC